MLMRLGLRLTIVAMGLVLALTARAAWNDEVEWSISPGEVLAAIVVIPLGFAHRVEVQERVWYVTYEDEDNGALENLPTPEVGDWRWVHHQVDGGWLMELVEA